MGTPRFLVVGHITRDLLDDGTPRLGGTAFYAAVAASRLGCRAAVYTATSPDLDLFPLYLVAPGVEVISRPALGDTTFCNRYRNGRRWQLLLQRADLLSEEGLPPAWRAAPLVLLGPVAQEVAPAWVHLFPQAMVGACLQGWLRDWDAEKRVWFTPWKGAKCWLPYFAAAFLSEEDIPGQLSLAEQYAARCPLLVLTRGERGAVLYQQGQSASIAPFSALEVEPTGAGDVFAAAFLIRYAEGVAPSEAARFAAAAAALSVQGHGAEAIPLRSAVEALLEKGTDVVAAP